MNSMSVLLVIQTLTDYNKTRKVGKKTPKSKKQKTSCLSGCSKMGLQQFAILIWKIKDI